MLRRMMILLLLSVAMIKATAQDCSQRPLWDIDFTVGFNNDGPELGFGGTWYPVKSFGVRMSIDFATEYDALVDQLGDMYDDYDLRFYDYVFRFKFTPSLILKSPALYKDEDDDMGLYVFANPGITLSPGARGSEGADWHNWDLRAGLELSDNTFILRLGYGFSDYNLYSGDPYTYSDKLNSQKRKTHTGYVTFGFRF